MIICHVYLYESIATDEFREFVRKNNARITHSFADCRKVAITDKGNEHYFMGESKYAEWCKGRTYMIAGRLMHSGYEIRREKHE